MFHQWVVFVIGVASLGILLDILVPEGQLNKYIRGIFSLFVVFVLVSPLPELFNAEYNIFDFFDVDKQYEADDSFLKSAAMERFDVKEKYLEDYFFSEYGVVCGVDIYISEKDYNVPSAVYLSFSDFGIRKREEHINIIEKIISFTKAYLSVSEEIIKVDNYGRC